VVSSIRSLYRAGGWRGLVALAIAVPVGLLLIAAPDSRLAKMLARRFRSEQTRRDAAARKAGSQA
jgi:hypothetical protein